MAAITLTHAPIQTVTIIPTADLAVCRFVGLTRVGHCGADAKAFGVTDNKYSLPSGVPGACFTAGIVFVEASAEIAVGAAVASTANGRAVTATAVTSTPAAGATPVTSTGAQPAIAAAGGVLPQAINGRALTAATTAGDLILVQLGSN